MKYRILILLITLPLAIPAFACMRQGSACYKNCKAAFPDNPTGEFFCDLGGTNTTSAAFRGIPAKSNAVHRFLPLVLIGQSL